MLRLIALFHVRYAASVGQRASGFTVNTVRFVARKQTVAMSASTNRQRAGWFRAVLTKTATHCSHDELTICGIDPNDVSEEDKARLEQLGFFVSKSDECFRSLRFGSA